MVLELDHLSDRELLIRVVGEQEHMSGEITETKTQLLALNGTVAAIKAAQLFQRGAIAMLAFLLVLGVSAASVVTVVLW